MKITLQAVFSAAWQAFIVEGKDPAFNTNINNCVYLDNNGNKCAVGLCIPDGHPAQKCIRSVSFLMKHYPDLFNENVKTNKINVFGFDYFEGDSLVTAQRSLHDALVNNSAEWNFTLDERKKHYLAFAKEFNLEVPNEN
jgi:hypothetical protein